MPNTRVFISFIFFYPTKVKTAKSSFPRSHRAETRAHFNFKQLVFCIVVVVVLCCGCCFFLFFVQCVVSLRVSQSCVRCYFIAFVSSLISNRSLCIVWNGRKKREIIICCFFFSSRNENSCVSIYLANSKTMCLNYWIYTVKKERKQCNKSKQSDKTIANWWYISMLSQI